MPLMHGIVIGFCDFYDVSERPDAVSTPEGVGAVTRVTAHSYFSRLLAVHSSEEKKYLAFVNFRVSSNPKMRIPCQTAFKGQPWVEFHESGLTPWQAHVMTARSKYVVSPQGAGIDCHRIYEAIYLGAVPVLISSPMDYFYKNLPVVIVQDWNTVTEDYLNSHYAEHSKRLEDWKRQYSNWTRAEFWLTGGDNGPFV